MANSPARKAARKARHSSPSPVRAKKTRSPLSPVKKAKKSNLRLLTGDDEQDIKRCLQQVEGSHVAEYDYFLPPQVDYSRERSKEDPRNGRRALYVTFKCKTCNAEVPRATNDSSPGNLRTHIGACQERYRQEKLNKVLEEFGYGGKEAPPSETRQCTAIVCAVECFPLSAFEKVTLKPICSKAMRENMPSHKVVSEAVTILARLGKTALIECLKNVKGGIYILHDEWTSPTHVGFMALVACFLETCGGETKLVTMPLKIVPFIGSHSGANIAALIESKLVEYGIDDRVMGIGSDNASACEKAVEELGRVGRLDKQKTWVRCFAHTINLLMGAMLKSFALKPYKGGQAAPTEDDDDNDNRPAELAVAEERDVILKNIARSLTFSTKSRDKYEAIVKGLPIQGPKTVMRATKTRWNSTYVQLETVLRVFPALLEWQKAMKLSRDNQLADEEKLLIEDLLFVMKVRLTSLRVLPHRSRSVISGIDEIFSTFEVFLRDDKKPAALHNAVLRAHRLLKKYYNKTDECLFYRVGCLLHPSKRVLFLKEQEWESAWVDGAVDDAVAYLEQWYSGGTYPSVEGEEEPAAVNYGNSATTRLHAAALQKKRNTPAAALRSFVHDDPVFGTANGVVTDMSALDYWIGEQRKVGGHSCDALVDMAVDIFTCPASTVDVERVFSRGRRTVSDFQHRLAPAKIADLINLANLYKEGLIRPGMLAREQAKKAAAAKAKSGNTRSLQAAFARQAEKGKAKALVLSESEGSDDEESESEEDEDVPMPGVGEKEGDEVLLGADNFCYSASEDPVVFIPESPRWLAAHGKTTAARKVLYRLDGTQDEKARAVSVDVQLHEILTAVKEERKAASGFSTCFRMDKQHFFRRVFLGMGAQFMQQISGINLITYYAPVIFETSVGMSHDRSLLLSGLNGVAYFLSALVPILLLERVGQRKLLSLAVDATRWHDWLHPLH